MSRWTNSVLRDKITLASQLNDVLEAVLGPQPAVFGAWRPPPRPDWLARVIEEGRCMDSRGVVPLDAASLLATARSNTGLDDFGADEWVEPFDVFVESLEEAELHLMGRLMARAEILNLLEVRLQVEDQFRRHPEIADEVVNRPIIIVGQGRSGTSALLNLLAEDPRMGAMRTWETMFPVPPPTPATYDTDARIEKADRFIRSWDRVTPELAAMHENGGAVPQECCKAHALTFRSVAWLGVIGQTPTYTQYMRTQDMTPAYRYQKRLLQLLQWKNPRQHWVLKTPAHLDFLPEALTVFPDACLLWPHRDPLKALASNVSLIGTAQWGRSDMPFKSDSYGFVTSLGPSARRLERVIDWLEEGVVPRDQLLNLHYEDLVRDPLGTAAHIYDHFGIGFPDDARERLATYVVRHPRSARPPHRYELGDDEQVSKTRAAFARYRAYFDVRDESARCRKDTTR